jgi:hypothetical protein
MTSLDNQVKSLCKETVDTKKDIHEELNLRIQGTQVEIETTLHGLETFHKLHYHTQCEFKTHLAEVEARAKHRSCRTGTGVGAARPPKLDRSTSWAVSQQQFETVAEHNCRQP